VTAANPGGGLDARDTIRALAFVLPQFHPIPENDAWWGPGFTEWRNVVQARPLARWHQQPHLPADLGFYDLRVPEVRQAQADLAHAHGIHGFVYHHYWFMGRRLLERPVDEILASGEPRFPFALSWANEHWSRTWDGAPNEVLMAQDYSPADDVFQPDFARLGRALRRDLPSRIIRRLHLSSQAYRTHWIWDYPAVVDGMLGRPAEDYLRFPSVSPSWDNTPRRQERGMILRNASPTEYERWLRTVLDRFTPPSPDENLLFINAWNEWAESNHLEPCLRWGLGYLEATKRALDARNA